MHVETRAFFIFQIILGTKKNFRNLFFRTFFQVLLSTIFYNESDTFTETFLTWSSLTSNIFFLLHCQKQKFRSTQGHSWNVTPLARVIFL